MLEHLKRHLEMELNFGNEHILSGSKKSVQKKENNKDKLLKLEKKVLTCKQCKLSKTRTNVVFGEGNPNAKLMFIGEGPGRDEDFSGRPFVGKAGQLLTKMIEAMKLKREDVYICNVVKCRPPGNRNPEPDEINLCSQFLEDQIKIIKPKVICGLGAVAVKYLLKDDNIRISRIRGKKFDYNGIILIPTFHPSYLLRNENMKKLAWQDLKLVMREIEDRR
jgi:DNA polymerase